MTNVEKIEYLQKQLDLVNKNYSVLNKKYEVLKSIKKKNIFCVEFYFEDNSSTISNIDIDELKMLEFIFKLLHINYDVYEFIDESR